MLKINNTEIVSESIIKTNNRITPTLSILGTEVYTNTVSATQKEKLYFKLRFIYHKGVSDKIEKLIANKENK